MKSPLTLIICKMIRKQNSIKPEVDVHKGAIRRKPPKVMELSVF